MRGKKQILSKKKLMKTTTISLAVFIAATLIVSSVPANFAINETNKIVNDEIIKAPKLTATHSEQLQAQPYGKETKTTEIIVRDSSNQLTPMSPEDKTNLENTDAAPIQGVASQGRGSFPILGSFDLNESDYCVGVGFDGTDFWVSAGDPYNYDASRFFMYDESGALLANVTQGGGVPAGNWGYRDQCWDGSAMYCSYNTSVAGFSDVNTYLGNFGGAISPNRAMAWDGTYFYTSSFGSGLYRMEWNGTWGAASNVTQLTAAGTFPGAYGLAYDPVLNCLWLTNADYTGDVFQLDMLGNVLNVFTTMPEYNMHGGCTMANTVSHGLVLAILMQDDPDQIVFYDVHQALIDVEKELYIPPPGAPTYPCDFTICLDDTYGDTWNGGYLNISVNGVPVYSYLDANDYTPGVWQCHPITVNLSDVIVVDYTPGTWTGENVWYLEDCTGYQLWSETGSTDPNAHDHVDVVSNPPGTYIDADTADAAVDVQISTIITFRITVTNSGGFPVEDVWIYDFYDPSLEFIDADPYPTTVDPVGYYLEWAGLFPGVLLPGESIVINVSFHVVGPHCHIDENIAAADAWDGEGYVYDEDSCFVHCKDGLAIDVEKMIFNPNAEGPTTAYICLYDTYGDGWDSAYVDIYINGVFLGWATLSAGYGPACFYIPCNTGDIIDVLYYPGSWPSENYYYLFDSAFNVLAGPIWYTDASVAVPKGMWLDADDPGSAQDFQISTIVEFEIAVSNNGMFPLFDVNVTDIMDPSFAFIDSVPAPNGSLWWNIPVLLPGETIYISVFAHVVGPHCSIDQNFVLAEGYNIEVDPFYVFDEDSVFIHCVDCIPSVDVEKGIWIPATGATYSICLYDSYGDGWDWTYVNPGNYILVYVNNVSVGNYTLFDGTGPECHDIIVNNGDEITVDYVGNGPYQGENSYEIYDNGGNLVLTRTAADVLPGECIATISAGTFIDADTPISAYEVPQFEYVDFMIRIHNTGACCNLTDFIVYDFMDDSMVFESASPPPDDIIADPNGTILLWFFNGPLEYCNYINITITAYVVGEYCSYDENFVEVEAYCPVTGTYVYDDDSAWIHCGEPLTPSISVLKYVQDPDTYELIPADNISAALDVDISTVITFVIHILNDGNVDLSDIMVYDFMEDSLGFIDAPFAESVTNVTGGVEIIWNMSGFADLPPGYYYTRTIDAHVIGPDCNTDYNWAEGSGYYDYFDVTVYDDDYAYVHAIQPPSPGIDVEKYVWDDILGEWVDADTDLDALDQNISEVAMFKIAIQNTGYLVDLEDIYIYDLMDDSMTFVDASIMPDTITPVGGGTVLEWNIPGPLLVGDWINITVWAHVVGPDCSIDENFVFVEGKWYYGASIILWDNGPNDGGNAGSSQNFTSAGIGFSERADDFEFTVTTDIHDVHWAGAVWNPDTTIVNPMNFSIHIYADNGTGTEPTGAGTPAPHTTALATYTIGPILGAPGDAGFLQDYYYEADLNPPFTAIGGVKYWIGIQSEHEYPPQWGWITTSWSTLANGTSGFPYLGIPFWNIETTDNSFQLTGEPDSITVSDSDSAFIHCVGAGDLNPPVITDVTLVMSDPADQYAPYGWEYFSATVTDDVAVASVQLNVTKPDLSTEIVAMSLVGGDVYACNHTFSVAGGDTLPDYIYHIYATDTSAKSTESAPGNFDMPLNEDVNLDGKAHFMDLVAVSLAYNAVGPNGWIREDINNDGKAHFMDLVAVSLAYNDVW
jgi:hypothetical protein